MQLFCRIKFQWWLHETVTQLTQLNQTSPLLSIFVGVMPFKKYLHCSQNQPGCNDKICICVSIFAHITPWICWRRPRENFKLCLQQKADIFCIKSGDLQPKHYLFLNLTCTVFFVTKPNQIINKALLQNKIKKKLELAIYRHRKFQHTDGFTEMYISNIYSSDWVVFFLAINRESEQHSCINEVVHQKSNSTINNIYMTTTTKIYFSCNTVRVNCWGLYKRWSYYVSIFGQCLALHLMALRIFFLWGDEIIKQVNKLH